MPWLALPFEDAAVNDNINAMCEVLAIPTLVLIDTKSMQIITNSAEKFLRFDDYMDKFPFWPAPMCDISYSDEGLASKQSFVIVQNFSDEDVKEKNSTMLLDFATKYLSQDKSKHMIKKFFTINGTGGMVNEIRKSLQLGTPINHHHPMVEKSTGCEWFCDGCGNGSTQGFIRFRCEQDCDFDFCQKCLKKSREPLPESEKKPVMAIVNYEQEIGYFPQKGFESVDLQNIEQFLIDFINGSCNKGKVVWPQDDEEEWSDD